MCAPRTALGVGSLPKFACPCLQPSHPGFIGASKSKTFADVRYCCHRPFNFPTPLRLFGVDRQQFWIANNGLISFSSGITSYTPTGFEFVNEPVIGVFWADVDTRGACSSAPACNKVIWRLSTSSNNPGDLTTTRTFLGTAALPDYVLIITWLNVSVWLAEIPGPHPPGEGSKAQILLVRKPRVSNASRFRRSESSPPCHSAITLAAC